MPDHLPLDFGCAAVVGLGTAFLALQGLGALPAKGRAKLEIALLAEAELRRGRQRPWPVALALLQA